jgi:aminoglycoside phosphotransferase family enzyme/predicted kinase
MDDASTSQAVIAWLRGGGPWGAPPEIIETHAAIVFLSGNRAFKMKKPVSLGYLDFSTLEARRSTLARELELNRRTAPGFYLNSVAVTRTASGFEIAGSGEAAEWLLEMKRFPTDALLSKLWERGKLSEQVIEDLARQVARFHDGVDVVAGVDWPAAIARIGHENAQDLRSLAGTFDPAKLAAALSSRESLMLSLGSVLQGQSGDVRHCHGDLHLGNVFLDGDVPTLFDCIEFNDFYAVIPPLYDLAFLLMDLVSRDGLGLANRALNAWLNERDVARWPEVMRSLAVLPLYLAIRAEIRAKTEARRPGGRATAQHYLDIALAACGQRGASAQLVAIGGFSGTGKSTAARTLAPAFAGPVGAVHLRSDEIRKRLACVRVHDRLPASSYTPDMSRKVYETMFDLARHALGAGLPVIVDAVFAREDERHAIEAVANAAGVAFRGVWLDAPASVLEARITARHGDASDATVEVLGDQLGYAIGHLDWKVIDVSGSMDNVATAVRRHLAL